MSADKAPGESVGVRRALVALAVCCAVIAIVAAVSRVWFTAVGTALSAAGVLVLLWNTHPRRGG